MRKARRIEVVARQTIGAIIEGLESRQMLSASLDAQGLLNVAGGTGNDSLTVAYDAHAKGVIDATVDGKNYPFPASKVKRLNLSGGTGNDSLSVSTAITLPATESGGAGNDSLLGGNGNDSLLGGDGNDSLNGRGGNDSLNGGTGNDTLASSAGKDKMDGGTGKDNVDLSSTTGVPLNTLPQNVQDGLTTLAKGAAIGLVQSFADGGQTYYGTIVTIGGQNVRIVVNSSGAPVSDAPPGSNGGESQTNTTSMGAVVSVNAGANTLVIAINSENGPAVNTTFTVTGATTITAADAPISLGSLTTGLWVSIKTSSGAPTTALSIVALSKEVSGTVTAVDSSAGTLSVGGTVYKVSANANITINGAPGTLGSITVNSHAVLHLSPLDPTTAVTIADTTPTTPPPTTTHVEGTVASVDTTANTITLTGDTPKTYKVAAGATINLGGVASTLGAIPAGAHVSLTFLSTDPTTATVVAATIPTPPPPTTTHVEGTVASVDTTANTITLTGDTPKTYKVAGNATITLGGVASTLGAIPAGAHVALTFLSTDPTTATAVAATILVPPPVTKTVSGTIVSVDSVGMTVTLKNGGDSPVTYPVDPAADVWLNDKAATLAALAAGDGVSVVLNAAGTAIHIHASAPSAG